MKKKIIILGILFWIPLTEAMAQAVSLKAYDKRVEIITYLRELEPMVRNFPGNDPEGKPVTTMYAEEGKQGHRIVKYEEIKRIYQEALQYYFEGQYVASYRRFLEAQIAIEKMTEELSQLYVLRAEEMMKTAMERKNPNNPLDKTIVDISIEYGKGTYTRNVMAENREAPYSRRMYEPKEYHYVTNRYGIEKNIEMGYQFLGLAKQARIDALAVEKHLEKHQTLNPRKRKFRIEKYFGAINLCRDSKANAVNIFKLKYPYDNYYLQKSDAKRESFRDIDNNEIEGDVVKLEGTTYDFTKNPYIKHDRRLQATFDIRVPEQFRVDLADSRGRVYEKDTDSQLFLRYDHPRRQELGVPKRSEVQNQGGEQPAPAGQ
ncbi:MAG: hypothetical protein JJT78_06650 [Leptospira sp.]|nr:hypothetical protein [Leptospira sp.]